MILDQVTEEQVQEIIDLDKRIFPTMPIEEEEIRETLSSEGVQILLRGESGDAIGYVISLPHNQAYEFLSELDPELIEEAEGLYIESIGILPEHRSLPNLRKLWVTLTDQASVKGYKKITAHVRASEGLSGVFQKRKGAIKGRTIENWADFGEPFEYLEYELEGNG